MSAEGQSRLGSISGKFKLVCCPESDSPLTQKRMSGWVRVVSAERQVTAGLMGGITNDLTSGSARNVRSCQNYPNASRDR